MDDVQPGDCRRGVIGTIGALGAISARHIVVVRAR
jgi:hypothetical protein